jgi:hypothetical protein
LYIGLHVKYPLFLSDCNKTLNFLERFSKNPQMSNLMKIRPVGAELLRVQTDGRTDMPNLIIAFRNFTKSAQNTWDGVKIYGFI